jgi:MSHA biogenesis protein MshN
MSIINKMLQDLDRRGMSGPDAAPVLSQVRSVARVNKDREWFWRIIAVLMIAAVVWVGWIAWQLRPREPVATDQAFKASQDAQRNRTAGLAVPEQKPAAEQPVTEKPAAPAAEKPAPQAVETMKLAPGIDTPIREQPAKPAPKERTQAEAPPTPAPVPAAKATAGAAATTKLNLDLPPARILPPVQSQGPVRVERRDTIRTVEDRAESEFRRGAGLLNEGRISESEEAFNAALVVYPAYEAARQALVAISLEQRRVEDARLLLQEGLALNPRNVRFASVLARIYVERRENAAALDVINAVPMPEAGGPELLSMRGAVLQKLGRHAEAAEAFQAALRGAPQNGGMWVGLGVSLESLGKRAESADAFRRAVATGTLSPESRSYAEQRARQSVP